MNDEDYGTNNTLDPLVRKKKKKIGKWFLKVVLSCLPFLLLLIVVLYIASGAMSAYATVSGFIHGLFGGHDTETINAYVNDLDAISLDELIEMVENHRFDPSFYDMMMINEEEFLYLLNQVKAVNTEHVVRNYQIEAHHVYTTVEEEEDPVTGEISSETEVHDEYVYLGRTADSASIETHQLDWQLIYTFCLTNLMQDQTGWQHTVAEDGSISGYIHYGSNHEMIDTTINAFRMKYQYITDLARDTQTSYSMEECQGMVHTPVQYGDPDTEEGSWTYYEPHSVLESAYSGYTAMYYLIDSTTNHLTSLVTAADMHLYDIIGNLLCYNYNFDYTVMLLEMLPGMETMAAQLRNYHENFSEGVIIQQQPIDYTIGYQIRASDLPTSDRLIRNDFDNNLGYDNIDYGELGFEDSIGGAVARAAISKIGCAYDQGRRWAPGVYDCSSFAYRMYQEEVGYNIGQYVTNTHSSNMAKQLVTQGFEVNPADVQPGDILFFAYRNDYGTYNGEFRNISHVAIYVGEGKKVHAKGRAYGVVMDNYTTSSLVAVCRPYGKQE